MQEPSAFADTLTQFLAQGTIVGATIVILWTIYLATVTFKKKGDMFTAMISKYVLPLGFLITLFGMFFTLLYSEVLHYVPCDLCWYQRVFLYPQVFIFAYAWYKKDTAILPYTLILSGVGLMIAVYHHMLQIGYDIYKPCSSAPFAVDCAKPSFIEFGFVTFPFMAVVLFSFLGLLIVTSLRFKK
jgi:disulfide bond formation protein DsbB